MVANINSFTPYTLKNHHRAQLRSPFVNLHGCLLAESPPPYVGVDPRRDESQMEILKTSLPVDAIGRDI